MGRPFFIFILLTSGSLWLAGASQIGTDSMLYRPLEEDITESLENFEDHTQMYLESLQKSSKIIQVALKQVTEVNPDNEFPQAIAWLHHEFIHYMCISYAVEQHIVENFRTIVASFMNNNHPAESGIPDGDMVLDIFPMLIERFKYYAYRDIMTVTLPNWQRMYSLALHYISQHVSSLEVNDLGHLFGIRAYMASEGYDEMKSFIENFDKNNSGLLQELSEDLPETSRIYHDGKALGAVLDELIVGTLTKNRQISPNGARLILFRDDKQVHSLVERYVPKHITDGLKRLGDVLKKSQLSWNWQNVEISKVTYAELDNFKDKTKQFSPDFGV